MSCIPHNSELIIGNTKGKVEVEIERYEELIKCEAACGILINALFDGIVGLSYGDRYFQFSDENTSIILKAIARERYLDKFESLKKKEAEE